MNVPLFLAAIFVIGAAAIGVGTFINFRRVRAGLGPSPTALRILIGTAAGVILAVDCVALISILTAGIWPALVVLIPTLLVCVALIVGLVQSFKKRPGT